MRNERFKVISIIDPALDTESITLAEVIEYAESRDISIVQNHVRPGQSLTVYHVRAVPHALWQSYIGAAGDNEELRVRRAFQCGVERVENLVGHDGVAVGSWEPAAKSKNPDNVNAIMTDEELNHRFCPSEVLEIGSVVLKHSFLPRRTAVRYALLSSLQEPLALQTYRSAVPSQSTASETSSSSPSAATASTTVTANA